MDHPEDRRRREEEAREREARSTNQDERDRPGDVLGIGDAEAEIPRATTDGSGNPSGIDVRERATGTGDLKPGKGATGIDMGAGGSGTDINPDEH